MTPAGGRSTRLGPPPSRRSARCSAGRGGCASAATTGSTAGGRRRRASPDAGFRECAARCVASVLLPLPPLRLTTAMTGMTGRYAADTPGKWPAPNVTARRRAREGNNCSLDWNTRRAARKARNAPQIGPTTAPRRFRHEHLARPLWRRRRACCAAPGASRAPPTATTTIANGASRSTTTGGCSRSSASRASRPASAGSRSSTSAPRSGVRSPISTLPGSPASAPATSSGCSAMRDRPPPRQDRVDDQQRKAGARLRDEFGSLAAYVWRFEPDARARPKRVTLAALRARGVPAEAVALLEGPAPARLELRRPDHCPCLHAGDGAGQRSPRRLPRAPARRSGTRRADAGRAACMMRPTRTQRGRRAADQESR